MVDYVWFSNSYHLWHSCKGINKVLARSWCDPENASPAPVMGSQSSNQAAQMRQHLRRIRKDCKKFGGKFAELLKVRLDSNGTFPLMKAVMEYVRNIQVKILDLKWIDAHVRLLPYSFHSREIAVSLAVKNLGKSVAKLKVHCNKYIPVQNKTNMRNFY